MSDRLNSFATWPASTPMPSDGIAGIYAERILDRSDDPRALSILFAARRAEGETLPAMSSAFDDGVPLYVPASTGVGKPRAPKRLLVAAAIALAIIPLGAMVAGATPSGPDAAFQTGRESGTVPAGEIDLPEIDGANAGSIVNPAMLGVPGLGFGAGSSGGSVTVNGRQHRSQVAAEVYTSEESTVTIDGQQVDSASRPSPMHPAQFPAIPGF